MSYVKLPILCLFAAFSFAACFSSTSRNYKLSDSKDYEASIFRQNCAICHGPEGEGKTLEDGKQIPNLRQPPFKYNTDEQIYNHIAEGGNGMVPFRSQLSERELRSMVEFVRRDLRGN